MPILESPVPSLAPSAAPDALLYDDKGRLTLEAETLGLFLHDVDWNAAFKDERVVPHVARTVVMGREVEDPETGAVFLEVFDVAPEGASSEALVREASAVEERAYGGTKMRGRKVAPAEEPEEEPEDDEEEEEEPEEESVHEGALVISEAAVQERRKGGKRRRGGKGKTMPGGEEMSAEEGESQFEVPANSNIPAAVKAGMAGSTTPVIALGFNSHRTTGETVGKGDRTHKAGEQALDYSQTEGRQVYPTTVEQHADGTEIIDVPEGLGVYVLETVDGALVAEHVDADDLVGMLPHFIEELPEETLEDRARRAIFADLTEVDYAAMFPGLAGADLEEAKRLFKKGDFRKRVFAGAKPGTAPHSQRMRQMLAMLAKGAIVRVGSGKGYRGGGYKYGKAKGGTVPGKKVYARFKIKRITAIRKAIKQGGVLKSQRNVVKRMIYPNLGSKMPGNWIPPQDRPDLGLGSLYVAIRGKAKAKAKGGLAVAKKAAQMKGSKGGKSPLTQSTPPSPKPVVTEARTTVPPLVRSVSGRSGPALAGLVERQLHGQRAEHQTPLTEGAPKK